MSNLLLVILTIVLSVIIYQDFKSREISWFLIPLLLTIGCTNALINIDFTSFLTYSSINLTTVILNLLGVTIFVSLKEKKITNIVDSYLGLGDILFFLVLTVLFSPINFFLFFIGSILIISLIYGGVFLFNKNKETLIPLAGAMSLLLIVALVLQYFTPSLNFYQDFLILD